MKTTGYIAGVVHSYRREIRFFVLFVLLFAAGQTIHYATSPFTAPLLIHRLSAGVGAAIINTVTPGEHAGARGPEIRSGGLRLTIEKGCEGIEGILLVIAAVGAYHAGLRWKLFGILAGTAAIYIANLVRILALYYTFKYHPALFDMMHILVGQTFVIFVGVLFFFAWTTSRTEPHGQRI